MRTKVDIASLYQENLLEYELALSKHKRAAYWLVLYRVITFLVLILTFYLAIAIASYFWFFSIFTLAGFLFLVKKFQKNKTQIRFYQNLIDLNRDELKALNYNFSSFLKGFEFEDSGHDFASDIDVFGEKSLYQMLCRKATKYGAERLAFRLKHPLKDASKIEKRQIAIEELAEKLKFRQFFLAKSRLQSDEKFDKEKAISWANDFHYLNVSKKLLVLNYVFPLLSFAFLSLFITDIVSFSTFLVFAIIPLIVNGFYVKSTNLAYESTLQNAEDLSHYGALLHLIEEEEFQSEHLLALKGKLEGDYIPSKALSSLRRIISNFDNRNNPIGAILFNVFLNWDIRLLLQLKSWKNFHKEHIENWLEVLFEFDVLMSMGNYNFNNPKSCIPKMNLSLILKTQQLAHPLLDENVRIGNDFEINEAGKFVILTGANMAGKSTFLRSIAVNFVLAMNGLRVCADSFEFSPISLISSMRTTDSLGKNESYFYTELKRLQYILKKLESDGQVFIILDEILKGTNSKDKAEGSKLYLEKLLKLKATGIVATHDLSLCELEEKHPEHIANYSFDIEVQGSEVHFDYLLKKEICKNMNASLLMKNMGLV